MAILSAALEFASATDPGRVRSHNEDSIGTEPEVGLAVLADGMGGYNAGEVASGIAVAVVSAEIKRALSGRTLHSIDPATGRTEAECIALKHSAKANTSIFEAARSQPQYSGMGTTLVVALFFDNRVCVAHVGDSRLYRLRADAFEQITRDHSLLQEQIDSGMITREAAKLSQNKNLVTRALGIDAEVETEVHVYETKPGDTYLLCSDGLSDMVGDDDMKITLASLQANLQLAAEQLVQQANDNGGRDNISVILVRVKDDYAAPKGWIARLISWFK
ncbi:MAG: Stp1/IreP family PP2C-type Ser/Thr phosphatase [Burkholderiales bacterium]|nr:Stp1/IreP family PP2C-type Ser/Thr phosphatase [Burkholderiales bacterium]